MVCFLDNSLSFYPSPPANFSCKMVHTFEVKLKHILKNVASWLSCNEVNEFETIIIGII